MSEYDPHELDTAELTKRLRDLAADKRNVDVDFLLHLEAFDARNAYLDAGFCSLWDFCLRELHLREGTAGRRIAAMRVLRRFPSLEAPLRDGRLCLSTVALLGPVLTAANLDEVVGRAAFRTRAEVDHLVASLQPRLAPKEGIRKLPEPRAASREPARAASPGEGDLEPGPSPAPALDLRAPSETIHAEVPAPIAQPPPAEPRRSAELRAVSATSWSLRVTIDEACKADLETLVALLSHAKGSDLAAVLHEAVRCAIDKHGKRRGAVDPARAMRAARDDEGAKRSNAVPSHDAGTVGGHGGGRYIPLAVQREVWKRDGGCCTWIGLDGRRCGSRWKLQIDHIDPFARGGRCDDPRLLRLLCANHNGRYAEQVYGREHMSRFRRARGGRTARKPTVKGLFVREPELAWGEAGSGSRGASIRPPAPPPGRGRDRAA